ncbi:MAG TPA: hypothetical protein QGF58_02565 [Myxococcota bacterium]|nr:hypothetical protein [Myxococcota bacterium]
MARVLLLIWGCGPCASLVGWYDGTISGDREGFTEFDVATIDETHVELVGFWSPSGLPRTGEVNFSTTRACDADDTVTQLDYDELWHHLPNDSWERWVGQVTFQMDKQGITGGWFFDIEAGPTEAELEQQEQIAGTWAADNDP